MSDMSNYKITDWEWVDRLMAEVGIDEFWDYLEKVWDAIDNLYPKQHYNIETKIPPERQELFIKFGCLYILDHGGCEVSGIQFSEDYTKIIRYKMPVKK
jgi:hypothetical protein